MAPFSLFLPSYLSFYIGWKIKGGARKRKAAGAQHSVVIFVRSFPPCAAAAAVAVKVSPFDRSSFLRSFVQVSNEHDFGSETPICQDLKKIWNAARASDRAIALSIFHRVNLFTE